MNPLRHALRPVEERPVARAAFGGTSRFVVRRRIGSGGGGVVYEVEDVVERDVVALKTLHTVEARSLLRLKNEFRALQGIHHPNLVTLGELLEADGQWFFTMEYVPGDDLLEYVCGSRSGGGSPRPSGVASPRTHDESTITGSEPGVMSRGVARCRPDDTRLREVFRQLSLGLLALHEAGVVHRDIKPENIRVTPEGRVVLLDFGLATDARGPHSGPPDEIVGTVYYMAPEQAAGHPIGPEADWYALGVVLYEALTGELPYDGLRAAVFCAKQRAASLPPPTLPDGVPDDLRALCLSLLHADPKERPTGAAVLRAFGGARGDLPAAPRAANAPVRLLGRDAEIRTLQGAFERARMGEASVACVFGESGVGKSALLHAFAERLDREGDPVVLRGKCYERESVPYKALDGVIDALSQHLRALPIAQLRALSPPGIEVLLRVFPTLGRLPWGGAAAAWPTDDQHDLRQLAFAVLRALLERVSQQRAVVIVIDDMQWSDADSHNALSDLLAPPHAPPLLVVLAARSDARLDLDLRCATLRIDLGPLADRFAVAVARDLLTSADVAGEPGAAIDPEVIAREAGGHPLFLGELIRHACTVGRGLGGEPASLDDALLARVERLGDEARRVLELTAVAEIRTHREAIRWAADVPRAQFNRAVESLRAAMLVRTTGPHATDDIEPFHDRVREAVAAHLPQAAAAERHRRLALALESSGISAARPERLVRHLEASGQLERAAGFAREAGVRAMAMLAFDRAAEFFAAALRLGSPSGEEARALEWQLAEALSSAGRGPEAADMYLAAAAAASPSRRLDCMRLAAQQLLWSGHIARGLRCLDSVLGEIGLALPTSRGHAVASLLWRRAQLLARGVSCELRPLEAIPPRALVAIDVCQTAAFGLALVDPITAMDMQTRGALLALEAGEYNRVVQALLQEAVARASRGHQALDGALRLTADAARRHRPSGGPAPWAEAASRAYTGVACFLGGRHAEAVDHLRVLEPSIEAVQRDAPTLGAKGALLDTGRMFRLWALLMMGRLAELRSESEAHLRDALRRGDRYLEVSIARAFHAARLSADSPDEARRALTHARAVWSSPVRGLQLQQVLDTYAHAECDLYEGRAGGAEDPYAADFQRFERSLLTRVEFVRLMMRWLRGRLCLAKSASGASRERWLDEATRAQRSLLREGVGYAIAWAALLGAGIAARRGSTSDAVAALREAVSVGARHDLAGVVAAAHHRLGALLTGSPGRAHEAEARGWAVREGVVDAERMFTLLAPGFREAAPLTE